MLTCLCGVTTRLMCYDRNRVQWVIESIRNVTDRSTNKTGLCNLWVSCKYVITLELGNCLEFSRDENTRNNFIIIFHYTGHRHHKLRKHVGEIFIWSYENIVLFQKIPVCLLIKLVRIFKYSNKFKEIINNMISQ